MIDDSELLGESVVRLEQALAAERSHREEAEATLAGIRGIIAAPDLAATDAALLAGLAALLRYQAGAVLVPGDDGVLVAVAGEHPALRSLRWSEGPLLRRVLAGQVVALFDVRRSPELAALGETAEVRSALCVPLRTSQRAAVLLGVHAEAAFFTPRHVALARGFSQTVRPALESLAAREDAHHRRLAEEQAAALTRHNEALRAQIEQLQTIRAQQERIRRLSAPVLQIDRQVLVVPVIGDLGHESTIGITEALLHAITERRARVVILDLTGLDTVDAGVSARLGGLSRAVALVGARCLVTGIPPRIAAALADCGAANVVRAFATLADGLRAALALR